MPQPPRGGEGSDPLAALGALPPPPVGDEEEPMPEAEEHERIEAMAAFRNAETDEEALTALESLLETLGVTLGTPGGEDPIA